MVSPPPVGLLDPPLRFVDRNLQRKKRISRVSIREGYSLVKRNVVMGSPRSPNGKDIASSKGI
jgi:hypothetical protein